MESRPLKVWPVWCWPSCNGVTNGAHRCDCVKCSQGRSPRNETSNVCSCTVHRRLTVGRPRGTSSMVEHGLQQHDSSNPNAQSSEVAAFVDFENVRYSTINSVGREPDPLTWRDKALNYGLMAVARAYADFDQHPQQVRNRLDVAGFGPAGDADRSRHRPGPRPSARSPAPYHARSADRVHG